MESVSIDLTTGDNYFWLFIRYGWRRQSRDSIGTVLCVDDDGILRVGFPGASRGWRADPAEMERVEEFKVGDWVRIRPALTAAVHGLEAVTPGSIGIVYSIRPDSSLLLGLCYMPGPWHCEPEDVEPVEPFRVMRLLFLQFPSLDCIFLHSFLHIVSFAVIQLAWRIMLIRHGLLINADW